jgi:hypothetical protein
VAGDEGEAGRQGAGVLLVVGAAKPARLDAQQAVVIADVRQRELAADELAELLQDERPRGHAETGTDPMRARTSRASATMVRTTSPARSTLLMPPTPWPAG